jgi:hypothetical protein
MFNIASWQLYVDVLKIQSSDIIGFVVPFGLIVSFVILCLLAVELRRWKNWKYIALGIVVLGGTAFGLYHCHREPMLGTPPAIEPNSIIAFALLIIVLAGFAAFRHLKDMEDTPGLALVTPLIPLLLVLLFHWEFIAAFMAGIAYGVLTTWKRNSINLLTRSIIDGITAVIPAVCLMMGIGMLINAVSNPAVTSSIQPLLTKVIPTHALSYIMVFTAIAPLALYRGPLSLWGMGSGLVSLIQKATTLGSQAIMGMLWSVGQLQGVCDPTNTHNIWIATYLGTDTQVLLRKTLPYAWTAAFCGLVLAVSFGYVRL